MKQKFLALCLFCATVLVFTACAKDEEEVTGSIYGIVTDADNGESIKSANVSLNPGGKSTVTGTDGRYEFLNLQPGQYTVQVVKSGYESNTKRITVEVGNTASGDVVLSKVSSKLKLSTNTLNFGSNWRTLSFSISNVGTSGSISWSVSTEGLDWLQVSPASGTTNTGKTSEVLVTVLREDITGPENGIITVRADGESLPINVTVNQNISQDNSSDRYLSVSPLSIDLGTNESGEFTIFSHNGVTSYKLYTRGIDGWLSFSEIEGTIQPYDPVDIAGTGETITVFAKHDGLAAGTYTGTIIVRSDLGDLEVPVSITVPEKEGGNDDSGDNTGGSSDSGSGTFSGTVTGPCPGLDVQLTGVSKSNGVLTVNFTVQNNETFDISQFNLRYNVNGIHFAAYDDTGNTYDEKSVQEIKMGGEVSSGAYFSVDLALPQGVKLSCSLRIKDVSDTATEFTNISLPCYYGRSDVTSDQKKIVFKNLTW